MYAYGMDLSLMEFGVYDHHTLQSLTRDFDFATSPSYSVASTSPERSPPTRRHDGTSPLPLGMDWSPPPHSWDGRDTCWPHDPHTGWSYCVTIPSWSILSDSRGSGPIVFYRVQIGIQNPEAITTTQEILRRFSDFVKLFSELKKLFPEKSLPAPPPRKLLGAKSRRWVEERRCSLEDWIGKLLSNIDISRSAPVAIFLDLEAAARSSFNDSSGDGVSSFIEYQPSSSISANASSVASDCGNDTGYEKSEIRTPRANDGGEGESFEGTFRTTSYDGDEKDILSEGVDVKVTSHVTRLSTDSAGSEVSSLKASEISNLGTSRAYDEGGLNFSVGAESPINEDVKFPSDLLVALPADQRHKFSRVLGNMRQRLVTAKADMEELVSRLNQELAVRQYLTTKVTDLEVELETTQENTKDNLQQALAIERERYTQMQWDMEEFRKKCLEMEMKLKAEQDEKMQMISEKLVATQENEMLKQELNAAREQLEDLQKYHEESETNSKTDVKLLVKEVKSLRSSQSELKLELSKSTKEKLELERDLQYEKQRREQANSVNEKLLHECAILQKRLQECSIHFLVEKEDKLIMDTSTSDAVDLLTTSDNRIGLLLAEAQLLAQDVENSVATADRTTVDELRKMLTELFIDSATARKQINSVIRCALKTPDKSQKDDDEEEALLKRAVLSKFL